MSGLTLDEIKRIGNIPVNFVLGKERSGTTLLQIMLNAHPNIAAPPESRFIILLYSRYGKIKKWTRRNLTRFCDDVMREPPIEKYWALNRQDLLESFLAAKEIATYPLLCKLVFYHFSRDKDITLFSDKNPVYAFFLRELQEIFPDATYIHIVRDYRANIVSHRRISITKQSTYISYRWLKMNMLVEESKGCNTGMYFTLKYEDLVSGPVKSVTDICNFLHVPFYEKMAVQHSWGIYPRFKENKVKRFRETHRSIFAPITPLFVNNWSKALTPVEIMQAEIIAGEFAEKMYGYKKYHAGEAIGNKRLPGLSTRLEYGAINRIYFTVLSNPSLYFLIKRRLYPYF